MATLIHILRGIVGIIAAYAVIVIFAIIFQDVMFGGLTMGKNPWYHMLIGGGMTAVGAFIGGYVLAIIANHRPFIYAIILAVWIVAEGIYLYIAGKSPNPLLFDIVASSSLSIGVLLGCYFRLFRSKQKPTPEPA